MHRVALTRPRPDNLPAVISPSSSRTWVPVSALLVLAVVAERWWLRQHSFPGDAWAAHLGAEHKSWLVWQITRAYQQIGRPLVAVGEVIVMLVWLWRSGGGRRAAQGLSVALLASASCGLIKIVCGPTPMWIGLHHVGTNFPSGVVTFVTASGGYLGLAAWRQGKRVLPLVVTAVMAGAGPARMLGGQHLLSDVIGGYMLGGAWLLAAHAYLVAGRHGARARHEAQWQIAGAGGAGVAGASGAGVATASVAAASATPEPAMLQSS